MIRLKTLMDFQNLSQRIWFESRSFPQNFRHLSKHLKSHEREEFNAFEFLHSE